MQVPDSDTTQVLLALLDVPMGSLASYNCICITHCTFAVLDELRESDPSAHTSSGHLPRQMCSASDCSGFSWMGCGFGADLLVRFVLGNSEFQTSEQRIFLVFREESGATCAAALLNTGLVELHFLLLTCCTGPHWRWLVRACGPATFRH
jgi:hypothetical protein